MIRLKNLLNELNISKDDMEKLHNDGEVEVDGQKITFKSETEVNEVSDSEIKKSIKKNERGGPYTIIVRHGNMSKKVVDHSPKSYDKVEDAIKMYHKYNKKHKGRGVSIEDGYGRTVFMESVNEAPPKMKNSKEVDNIIKTMAVVSGLQKGGMASRYGNDFLKAKRRALKAINDMLTYAKIGV
jgi:hypothetical protein